MALTLHMHESLLVLSGVIVGTTFTCVGCYLGAFLIKRTYMEITQPYPPEVLIQLDKEEGNTSGYSEAFDWDQLAILNFVNKLIE